MIEVRAKTDEAAAAGQAIIQGFLTEPDTGAVNRSPPFRMFIPPLYCTKVVATIGVKA